MRQAFMEKFYSKPVNISISNLGNTRPRRGERRKPFAIRFRSESLKCRIEVSEEELVGICISALDPKTRRMFENAQITMFADLEEAFARTDETNEEIEAAEKPWSHSVAYAKEDSSGAPKRRGPPGNDNRKGKRRVEQEAPDFLRTNGRAIERMGKK